MMWPDDMRPRGYIRGIQHPSAPEMTKVWYMGMIKEGRTEVHVLGEYIAIGQYLPYKRGRRGELSFQLHT